MPGRKHIYVALPLSSLLCQLEREPHRLLASLHQQELAQPFSSPPSQSSRVGPSPPLSTFPEKSPKRTHQQILQTRSCFGLAWRTCPLSNHASESDQKGKTTVADTKQHLS